MVAIYTPTPDLKAKNSASRLRFRAAQICAKNNKHEHERPGSQGLIYNMETGELEL